MSQEGEQTTTRVGNQTMLSVAIEMLDEMETYYKVEEEREHIILGINSERGSITCVIACDEESRMFCIYLAQSFTVPEHRRMAALEYLTRANFGLTMGNFELDLKDGEVRFKCCAVFAGTILSKETAQLMFFTAAIKSEKYIPGLVEVIRGNQTPADAIAEQESDAKLIGELREPEKAAPPDLPQSTSTGCMCLIS